MMMADNSTHLSPRGPEDLGGDRRFHVVEFAGNRAQRRQAARADRRKSTRPAKPEGIVDTTELAIHRATRLTDAERNRMLHPAREGFTALRRGVATHEQWAAVAGAVNVALAIETQGVVKGMREHFAAADLALDAVWHRVQDCPAAPTWGRSTTLYFDEIAALREAIHLHDYQLRQLSAAELQAAVDQVRRNVRAAGGREIAAPSQSLPVPSQHPLL